MVSPAVVATALAMTWLGAKSDTAAEMKKVLHLELSSKEMVAALDNLLSNYAGPSSPLLLGDAAIPSVRIANRLFAEASYSFEQPFLSLTLGAFQTPPQLVNFKGDAAAARFDINAKGLRSKRQSDRRTAPTRWCR